MSAHSIASLFGSAFVACGVSGTAPALVDRTEPPHAAPPRADAPEVAKAAATPEPEPRANIEIQIDRARLKKDVAFVAKPRPPKSVH